MKNSNKIGENSEKKQGMVLTVGDDVEHCSFRVQCTFPNMEGVAMLNKAVKYGKNQKKIGGCW